MKRTDTFIISTTMSKFSSNAAQLFHLIVWGWCIKRPGGEGEFYRLPWIEQVGSFYSFKLWHGEIIIPYVQQ